jgi:hypothetical protein
MTREAVLVEAERLAGFLETRFVPGSQPWMNAVTLWAKARSDQARHCLRGMSWRQGPERGVPSLPPRVITLLEAAEQVWVQTAEPALPDADTQGSADAGRAGPTPTDRRRARPGR